MDILLGPIPWPIYFAVIIAHAAKTNSLGISSRFLLENLKFNAQKYRSFQLKAKFMTTRDLSDPATIRPVQSLSIPRNAKQIHSYIEVATTAD